MNSEVDALFEKHSVDEIRRICIDLRNDVEGKKMELRFLVGERHRDIIEASDNILLMKDFSYSITNKLSELEACCVYNLANASNDGFTLHQLRNPKKLIASQLKLLLDIPEMIWSALDNMDYTGAVEFFLLGRYLSVKLQLTGETMAAHVNARVLVKRQWAALDYVETTIASACRKQLALPTASNELISQVLAALLVLEDLPMLSALEEFFSGRSTALSCLLGVDKNASSGQLPTVSSISVEQRLSMVVDLLTQTAQAVATLFLVKGQISNLLEKMAKWCPRETTWFSGENLFEHLPDNVANYHVTLPAAQSRQLKSPALSTQLESENLDAPPSGTRAVPLEADTLIEHFKIWWQSTMSFCQKHLSTVLSSYLLDLGGLVETRRMLLVKLSNSCSSMNVHGYRIDLWTELFQVLFLQHLEVLLKSTFNDLFTEFEAALFSLVKSIDKTASSSTQSTPLVSDQLAAERDLASFVWSQGLTSLNKPTSRFRSRSDDQLQTLDTPLDQLLDVAPKNLVFIYFACLVGRQDLLPPPSNPSAFESAAKVDKEESGQHQLPGPLRWRLGRLLESATFTYSAFDCRKSVHQEEVGENIVAASRHDLSRKRKLVTPQLKQICSTFNNRVCEVVATAASEDVATWKAILSVIEGLIGRFSDLAQRIYDELNPNSTAHGIFCVVRACFCLLDVYPALGATVVTATARLLVEESKSTSFAPWMDMVKLRQAWLAASQPLRSIATRLSLSAVLRTTIESSILEDLFNTLFSVCQTSKNEGDDDAKLVSITSQWTEIKLNPPTESDQDSAVVILTVPSYPSWPLQETLLALSRNLTTLSVHVLPRGTLSEEFGLRLADSLLSIYQRLAQTKSLTQSQAFQLLFDVRFILRLLVWPLVTAEKRPSPATEDLKDPVTVKGMSKMGQDLLKRLEGAVDPFDLEMSSEHLDTAIGRAVKATSALYAALLPVFLTANRAEESEKMEEQSYFTFFQLTPSSKLLEGQERVTNEVERSTIPVFGLLPFSLSQVRPPPQLITVAKAKSQTPIQSKSKDLSSSRGSAADFSWFSGLSFT